MRPGSAKVAGVQGFDLCVLLLGIDEFARLRRIPRRLYDGLFPLPHIVSLA